MNMFFSFSLTRFCSRCERDEKEVEEEDEKCLVMSWRLTPLAQQNLLARAYAYVLCGCCRLLNGLVSIVMMMTKKEIYMSNALLMTHHIYEE